MISIARISCSAILPRTFLRFLIVLVVARTGFTPSHRRSPFGTVGRD
jgi:hypothetical protein